MSDNHTDEPHVFPEGRKPGEMLFGMMLLFFAASMIVLLGSQTTWLPGKGFAAQPRFWPALSLCGLLLFGGLMAWSRSKVERTPGRWMEAFTWAKSLEFIGWYMLYVLAISVIGYLLATVIFCAALTLRLGYRGKTVWAAVFFALFVVLFFKSAMNVKIPGGAIYQLAPEGLRYILLRYF